MPKALHHTPWGLIVDHWSTGLNKQYILIENNDYMINPNYSIKCSASNIWMALENKFSKYIIINWIHHGPLTKCVKLRVVHAPGMLATFTPPLRVSDPDMHHGTCVAHVPWCRPRLLTSDFLWSWRGKRSQHPCRMHNRHFYVTGKKPMFSNVTESTPVVAVLYVDWNICISRQLFPKYYCLPLLIVVVYVITCFNRLFLTNFHCMLKIVCWWVHPRCKLSLITLKSLAKQFDCLHFRATSVY